MAHHHTNCLNCGTELTGKYGVNCGQKADTHRITAKHFVMHDLLHGVLHIEKGLFYTLLRVFKLRGKSAQEYIAGKRIGYYNVFYLSLILLGLNILAVVSKHQLQPQSAITHSGSVSNIFTFAEHYIKYVVLTFIPLFAFNTFILFRRKKHNYAEHVVAAGFTMVAMLTLALLTNTLDLLGDADIIYYISFFVTLLVIFTPAFFYYSYTRPEYGIGGYLWRIVVFYVLLYAENILLILLAFLINGTVNIEGELSF